MKIDKGFTLIELLVVFAIIGIISAIILPLLSSPRTKGADASIKSNLKTVLTQSQLYYDTNGNKYNNGATAVAAGTTCPTAAGTMFGDENTVKSAIAAATTVSANSVTCYMSASGNAFVVWAQLKTAGLYWCVDSTGVSRQENAAQGANTSCP